MSIAVRKISKSYGSVTALDAVDFTIGKGEVVGFLGPNGAGKSSLMRILTTYSRPGSGTAVVNGHDIQEAAFEVRKSVGYLPEHNPLYLDMYVKEYLGFHAALHRAPRSAVDGSIERTGLLPMADRKIGKLSKGYRQRVGLAAALLHDPEVLLLDEPTTGLDPNQLQDIRALVRELGKEKTILLSTHILKEVEALCDRVLVLHKGRIVADRELSELVQESEQVIEVEFDYRVEEVLLMDIPDVADVRNTGGFAYELVFDTGQDRRPAVFDFAHDNRLKTLRLDRRNASLEDLFRELTQG